MNTLLPRLGAGQQRGPGLRLGFAFLGLLLIAGLQFALAGRAYAADPVPPNVSVGGVPIGGLDPQVAQAALQQSFSSVLTTPITLTLGSRVWTSTLSQLGASLDLTATVAQAFSATVLIDSADVKHDLPLLLGHDRQDAAAELAHIAAQVAVSATNADILLSQEKLELLPEVAGQRLETETTWLNIVSATVSLPFTPTAAPIVTATIQPTITAASLSKVYDKAVLMTGQPITLTAPMSGTVMAFTVQIDALRSLLQLDRSSSGKPLDVELPDSNLQAYTQILGQQVNHKVEDARLTLPDFATETEIVNEIPGRDLDLKATAKKLHTVITTAGAKRTLALPVKITPAKIVAADLNSVKSTLDAQLARSVELRYSGQSYTLSPERLDVALYLNADPSGKLDGYSLRLEDKDLSRVISRAAKDIAVPARDATYRLVHGRARLIVAASDGLSVDEAAALPLLRDALSNGAPAIDLPTNVVRPDYAFGGLSAIAAPDLLAEGQTFYGYSSPERNWNVTLGAARLDSWYIAPGATFSFNDALGPLTLAAGFKMGWAIQVQGGTPTTIPSEAGGICQVATTLFQGAFRSGLQISQRRNHSYWIATYGKAPSGLQGLDATVAPPWQDFKFTNNTGNWVLVRAHGDGQNITVRLYGTNPGWQVNISDPVITSVIQPNRTPLREYSDVLPPGKEVHVETAQPGFKAQITRQVLKDGQVIDEYTASGQYLPSRDRTIIGRAH